METTETSRNADASPGTHPRGVRNFISQGAFAHQAWILSSPSVVMSFIAVSLGLPIFLAGSLVALRHTAGTLIDVFALGWLSKARSRKRLIVLADVATGVCYAAFIYSLFWDDKVSIGIAFTMFLLLIGAINEVKALLITPFIAENLSREQRVRVKFLQVFLGGIGAIAVVVLAHLALAEDAALTRHALVLTAGAICFFLSGITLLTIRDVAHDAAPAAAQADDAQETPPGFFEAARTLAKEGWFRGYLALRLLFVMLGLSVPIFSLVTAQAHTGTAQGLTALVVSYAAALTISAPLWRVLNGYSYRLSMICGAGMIFMAGALVIAISIGETKQPVYFHAAAVFVATAAAAGLSGARSLFFMEIAPKDQILAATSVTKSIARFAIIGCSALLAGLAHTQDSVWAVILITASALAAVAACVAVVPASLGAKTRAANETG